MIHFLFIIGLFLLAVAVVMVVRAVTTRTASTETIEQIGAYGFAGSLPSSDTTTAPASAGGSRTSPARSAAGLLRHFERLRGNDYRSRLIAAGMYTTTPERLLGMQFLAAILLPLVWLTLAQARRAPELVRPRHDDRRRGPRLVHPVDARQRADPQAPGARSRRACPT